MSKDKKKTNVPPKVDEVVVRQNTKEIQKKKWEEKERSEIIKEKENREKWIQDFLSELGDEVKILTLEEEREKTKNRIKDLRKHFNPSDANYKLKLQLENDTLEMFKELIEDFKGENLRGKNKNDLPSINPLQENQKVMLLYELGIFDHLLKEHDLQDNYTRLAQIVESFTGIKQDTIRQTYRAIIEMSHSEKNNPYNNPKNIDFLNNSFNQFGISRKVKKGKI